MSRTLTISDELYDRLKAEAQARGLASVERLLEERERHEVNFDRRAAVVQRIDELRESLFAKYGQMPDSTALHIYSGNSAYSFLCMHLCKVYVAFPE